MDSHESAGAFDRVTQRQPLDEDALSQILKVLLEIGASLKRLEMDKGVRREVNVGIHEVEQDEPVEEVGEGSLQPGENAPPDEARQFDEQMISQAAFSHHHLAVNQQKQVELPQMTERHYYVIDTSEISSLAPESGDYSVVSQRPGATFCPNINHGFPELVSENSWRYCKLLRILVRVRTTSNNLV